MRFCQDCGIEITGGNAKKRCEGCAVDKKNEYSRKYSISPAGRKSQSKWREENKDQQQEYRDRNREKRYAHNQKPEVKKRISIKMKEYNQRPEVKERRIVHGWKKLGIKNMTMEEYNRMFKDQNGCCAICGRHRDEFPRNLSVDHDHETGKARGLLCGDCNIALGGFKDNMDLLASAVSYMSQV